MSETSTESITRPVTVGVLTAAIVGAGAWLIPGVWTWVHRITSACWNHFKSTSSFPNWSLYLLGAMAALSLFGIGSKILNKIRNKEPRFTSYHEDKILGATWRWDYFGAVPRNVWAFCPTCDTCLVYNHQFNNGKTITILTCEYCAHPVVIEDGDKDYLVAKVQRQIERKLRTGEWRASTEIPST